MVSHGAARYLGVLHGAALFSGGSLLNYEGYRALAEHEAGLLKRIGLCLSQQTQLAVKLCVHIGVFVCAACYHDVLAAVVEYVSGVADTL